MFETKYIPQENAKVIYKLLECCKRYNPKMYFEILDTEDLVYSSKKPNLDEMIKTLDGGDDEFGINCYVDGKYLGWFGILPYEDSECVVFDCSDNEFCMGITDELERN